MTSIGQQLLNVPMGDMIRDMALSIAEAQFELDKNSIIVAEMMGGQRLLRDENGHLIDYEGVVIEPEYDSGGNPVYDTEGNIVFADGRGPRIIDSRVYFGYTYEPLVDENGRVEYWGAAWVEEPASSGTFVLKDGDGAGSTISPEDATMKMVRKPKRVSMLELGFTPTFYQFVDSMIEVKIGISISSTREWSISASSTTTSETNSKTGSWSFWKGSSSNSNNKTVTTTSVDASYSSKYSYSAEGASVLRTKLVPLPPPAILEDRIREVMQHERDYIEKAAQGAVGLQESDSEGGS